MKARHLLAIIEKKTHDNAPEILTAIGVSGVVTTAYLAASGGQKAGVHLAAEKESLRRDLTRAEKIKSAWRFYIPAFASGVATIVCVVGSHRVSAKRTAAAYSLLTFTDTAFKEYREKVVEHIGPKKEELVRDEIVKDRIARNPPSDNLIVAGSGSVLCCEMYTGRYFQSEIETLRKAVNQTNSKALREMYVTLTDFYGYVGLPFTAMSDEFGWSCDKLLEIKVTPVLTDDGRPCVAFDYNYIKPRSELP